MGAAFRTSCILHTRIRVHCSSLYVVSSSFFTVLQKHLQQLKPEELATLNPRVSERMARDSDGIRNRLEEARRMNIDEMRELQRLAVCSVLHTCTNCTCTQVEVCSKLHIQCSVFFLCHVLSQTMHCFQNEN